MTKSIAVVVGTRPEIIKLAGVATHLEGDVELIHTGQHWDHEMSGQFWDSLSLPTPAHRLQIGARTRADQISMCLSQLAALWGPARPDVVVVHGDTNTALGGALAANSLELPVVHVEAGLRSHDRRMPEEHNRVMVDHLSDLCLAPTPGNADNLRAENIGSDRVRVTGNTIVDAVHQVIERRTSVSDLSFDNMALAPGEYIVATIHRPENTDDPQQLAAVLHLLGGLAASARVVLSLHPRTADRVATFGLEYLLEPLVVVEPLGYEDFIHLCAHAGLIVSDSGGIQEEASVLGRPVVVLRRSTERPEGLGTTTTLCSDMSAAHGTASQLWRERHTIHAALQTQPSPFGDRTAPLRCATEIRLFRDTLG